MFSRKSRLFHFLDSCIFCPLVIWTWFLHGPRQKNWGGVTGWLPRFHTIFHHAKSDFPARMVAFFRPYLAIFSHRPAFRRPIAIYLLRACPCFPFLILARIGIRTHVVSSQKFILKNPMPGLEPASPHHETGIPAARPRLQTVYQANQITRFSPLLARLRCSRSC